MNLPVVVVPAVPRAPGPRSEFLERAAVARQKIAEQVVVEIRRLRLANVSWRAIARLLEMSPTTVFRHFGFVDGYDVGVTRGEDGLTYLECLVTGVRFRDPADLVLDDEARLVLGQWSGSSTALVTP